MATSVPCQRDKLGRARSFCWTLNNYNDTTIERLREYAKSPGVRYLVFGYETAPTTGTPHLQGFTAWDNPRSLDKFKEVISPSVHIEKMRGNSLQASDYCKYDDYPTNLVPNKFEEFGTLPTQGSRTDWCVAVEQINSGLAIEEVIAEQPQLLPGIRALERYKCLTLKPKHRVVSVYVLWGDAGTGKTRWAYEHFPELYSKPRGEWWDGYSGQTAVLLDDFYGWIAYSEMLRVLDRYPYQVPIKGGYVQAQWDTVIITSNKSPDKWYSTGMTPALERRINNIFFLSIDAPQLPPPPCLSQEESPA